MQNFVFHSKPKFYGLTYLILIPIFAAIYFYLPGFYEQKLTIIESIYFSAVTITTLGYGDITPSSDLGKIIAATESVLGIILIGLFLNALSRVKGETAQQAQLEKDKETYKFKEIANLYGYYCIMKPISHNFKDSIIEVTNPINADRKKYNPKFTLNDMRYLHSPSIFADKDPTESVVSRYFRCQSLLGKEISDIVKNIDLKLFPNLEKHCLEFISTIHAFDFSGAILQHSKNKQLSQLVAKMLEEHTEELELKKSHLINGYIYLHHQIKSLIVLIELIETEINCITSSKK